MRNIRILLKSRKIAIVIFILAILYITLALTFSCTPNPERDTDPKAVATIYPVYDMARHVAGDKLEVVYLINPGESPHTFEFTPERIKRLEGAHIAFKVGLGLDDWLDGTIKSLGTDINIHDIHKGIELIGDDCSHGHGSHHNPHIWLSLKNAKIIVENIYAVFSESYPEHSDYFNKNKQDYLAEVDNLKSHFVEEAENFKNREFIAHHDAWVYMAEELGIEQIMSVEPFPGKEPTPEYIIELQKTIDKYDIHTVFIEPQLSSQVVNFLTQDMDLNVKVLDPLGGTEGRDTYLRLMSYNFNQISDALK